MTTTLSPAAQIIISIIPIVGIVIGGVVIFFYLLWHHKHVSLQIKTGTFRHINFNWHLFSLLAGLLLTGVGIVLTVLFLIVRGADYAVLGGLIPLACGISLIVFYKLYPNNTKTDEAENK